MDKFFYRLIVQTLIKGIFTAIIVTFCSLLLYTLLVSILYPMTAKFDYWFQAISVLVITVITCFMMITVKDSYEKSDTHTYSVGRFWVKRCHKNKKVHWIFVDLLMFPLLAAAVVFGYSFYVNHPIVLSEYVTAYSVGRMQVAPAKDLFMDTYMSHFAKLMFAVFFYMQWKHVREFAKIGRCRKCKAAFALGHHRRGGKRTEYSSEIKKKGKRRVVGSTYEVTTEDGREVDRRKVGDIYEMEYDYYQTDTARTYSTNTCICAFCGELCEQTDVSSTSTTKKIS